MDWGSMAEILSHVFAGNVANYILTYSGIISLILFLVFFYYPNMEPRMRALASKAKPFIPWLLCILLLSSVLVAAASIVHNSQQEVVALREELEECQEPFAIPSELSASHLVGKRIRVVDLAVYYSLIENRVFDDCEFFGPAVVQFQDPFSQSNSLIFELALGDTVDSIFIVTPNDTFTGVIAFKNCIFNNCRFMHVGIIGKEDLINKLKARATYEYP